MIGLACVSAGARYCGSALAPNDIEGKMAASVSGIVFALFKKELSSIFLYSFGFQNNHIPACIHPHSYIEYMSAHIP